MAIAFCPECGFGIELGERPKVGRRVTCPECGAGLEVVNTAPLELDWIYSEIDDEPEDEEWVES